LSHLGVLCRLAGLEIGDCGFGPEQVRPSLGDTGLVVVIVDLDQKVAGLDPLKIAYRTVLTYPSILALRGVISPRT